MVLQWLASAALPPLGLYVLYAPAVWVATRLALISDRASDFHGAFVLTMMCGAQCAVVAAVLARVADSVLALRAKVR
jgi:hypothetical protein